MKRSELLAAVEAVMVSVDKSKGQTGMDFLMLDKNWVRGFNDILSVSFPIITNITGAIKALELTKILGKMEGDTIRIAEDDGKILIKDAKTTLKMTLLEESFLSQLQENISSLNTDKIKWSSIPKDFIEGLSVCLFSAGTTPELGVLAGVSFSEKSIIATDNYRVTLFTMSEEVSEPFILPTEVVNGLTRFGGEFNGISVTEAWVHFKVVNGTIISVRRLLSEYPTEKIIDILEKNFPRGKKAKTYKLPDGIEKSIDRTEVLASSDGDIGPQSQITFKRVGKHLVIKGANESGEVEDKILWEEGSEFPENIEIKISPTFLKKIISITKSFQLSPTNTTLMFDGKSFKHLIVAKIS
jgi:hypothetical protein